MNINTLNCNKVNTDKLITLMNFYDSLIPNKTLYIKTGSNNTPLLILSSTDSLIPDIYNKINASHIFITVFSDLKNMIAMLPLNLAIKFFPNNMTINQNQANINYTTLTNFNGSYITSYNYGSFDRNYTYTSFGNLLRYFMNKNVITLDNLKEFGDNLIVLTWSDTDLISSKSFTICQLFGKSGQGSEGSLLNGVTLYLTGVNYPKNFRYKNNCYANSYLGQIGLATNIVIRVDNNYNIELPNRSINKTNLQPETYKLWN